jgi:DNA mismatch endonuclease (patch repair protein)
VIQTAEERSRIMRAVKSRDTGAERAVRSLVHGMGYRYRLHCSDLPGKPDMVFPARRKVIFINGCFWHGHACARGDRTPKTNRDYWERKISRNRARDGSSGRELRALGWNVLVIWECQLKDEARLAASLRAFLNGAP